MQTPSKKRKHDAIVRRKPPKNLHDWLERFAGDREREYSATQQQQRSGKVKFLPQQLLPWHEITHVSLEKILQRLPFQPWKDEHMQQVISKDVWIDHDNTVYKQQVDNDNPLLLRFAPHSFFESDDDFDDDLLQLDMRMMQRLFIHK